jgi:hypothetical protein
MENGFDGQIVHFDDVGSDEVDSRHIDSLGKLRILP